MRPGLKIAISALIVTISTAAIVWAQSGLRLDPAPPFEMTLASKKNKQLLRDSKSGKRILRDLNMAPGDCASGSVKISSRVRSPLKVKILGESDGATLADHMRLRIYRKKQKLSRPRAAWHGRLSAFGKKVIKHYIPHASRGYRFEVCLDSDTPQSVSGTATVTDIKWRAKKKA